MATEIRVGRKRAGRDVLVRATVEATPINDYKLLLTYPSSSLLSLFPPNLKRQRHHCSQENRRVLRFVLKRSPMNKPADGRVFRWKLVISVVIFFTFEITRSFLCNSISINKYRIPNILFVINQLPAMLHDFTIFDSPELIQRN